MVNKPFWHISDFVFASYTFGCVKVLIFFFHSKETAAEVHREFQKVYGDTALSKTTCRDWFRRFKNGTFDVEDRPRKGRLKPSKTLMLFFMSC